MNPNQESLVVARKLAWFKIAEETLDDEVLFLNYAMTFGDVSDVPAIRKHYDEDTLRNALRNVHPLLPAPSRLTEYTTNRIDASIPKHEYAVEY